MHEGIKTLLQFLQTIAELKEVIRYRSQFYWKDYPQQERYESVADHSWRLAFMVMLIAPKLSRPVDLERMLKMALVHDLPEIIAGDVSPLGSDGTGKDAHAFNEQKKQEKFEKEQRAAEELFGTLGHPQGEELLQLWNEAESQETFESKVVMKLDKMEASLQVLRYRKGEVFPAHKEFMLTYNLQGNNIDPALEALAKEIAEEIEKQYKEFKK